MAKRRGRASEENGGKITAGQFAELSGLALPQLWKAVWDMDTDTAQNWIHNPAALGNVLVPAIRSVLMPPQVEGRDRAISIFPIPRTTPFNPAQFIGKGWSIWKGPADGDGLSGKEDQDERSLALTQLDLSQIQLVTCLQESETSITGEERIKRLKAANHIRLDAKIFQTFWENKHLIPKSWRKKINGYITYIFFDGTPLRGPGGRRGVLCFCWSEGEWRWPCGWLENARDVGSPSAVLAS